MQKVFSKIPWKKNWYEYPGADRALYISDIGITGRRGLQMKLIVFRNNRDLVNFWKKTMKSNQLTKDTRGVVDQLRTTHENPGTGKVWMEVDPRYFAVMGLLVTHLGQEIIAHESVHAGFAYAKRMGSKSRWYDSDNEEEEVCYAAGKIASAVNHVLHQQELYKLYDEVKLKLTHDDRTEFVKDIASRK